MKKTKRIRWIIILAIVLGLISYSIYLCYHYFFYNEYDKYLIDYTFKEGSEFTTLADNDPKVEGMVLVADNDILKLYTNPDTTEVAVYDKRSGETTYSNPLDRNNDPIAKGRNMVALNSQFMITYYDDSMKAITMYNYDNSVERNQFKIETLDNGIRYTYLLGKIDSVLGLAPELISSERMQEKILSKLSETDAKKFKSYYLESKDKEGFLQLMDNVKSSRMAIQKINAMLEQAGYTQADLDEDAVAAGNSTEQRITFTIVLEYRLVNDKLVVTLPTSQIVETGSGKISSIELLNFFGAGSTQEDGYMLVPNGSGSLIYFNNGKKTERYNQYIYGMDETLQSYTVVENTEKARMPVFGIKREGSAIFAEIKNGDALANVIAEVSGGLNSYNYVHPSFILRGSEKVSMFGAKGVSADLPTLEKNLYDLDITISYSFLNKEDASYSGMANYYRKELMEDGILTVNEKTEDIPFYLDIVGGVKQQKSILGAPYLAVYPMTSFKEAGTIIDALNENKVLNLKVNYLGWFNGGYYHDVATDIKIERNLGGKNDWEKLNKKLEANGSKLFGDVAFQKVSFESDHFNYKMESAQYYSGIPVTLGRVNPVTLRQTGGMGYSETNYHVLSPKFLVRHVDQFLDETKKLKLTGVSLRDMGDVLSADKRRNNVIDRQEAKQVVNGQLELIDSTIDNLMVQGGNAYSWRYASDLINVPGNHNPFYIVDEEIPFYEMVINGCIEYSTKAINLSDSYDINDVILRLIEYGASPHFTLSYRNSNEIKYSGLNSMYSTQYETWLKDAAEIYTETNEVLRHVTGSTIIDHHILKSGVKKITYDNGVIIYINTSGTEVNYDDVKIPARSYVLEGVEQ